MTEISYLHDTNRRFVTRESNELTDKSNIFDNLCRQLSDAPDLPYERRWVAVKHSIFWVIILYIGGLLIGATFVIALWYPPDSLKGIVLLFILTPCCAIYCLAFAVAGTRRIYLVIKKCREDYLGQIYGRLVGDGQLYEAEVTAIKLVEIPPYFELSYTLLDEARQPSTGKYHAFVAHDGLKIGDRIYVLQFRKLSVVL